MKGLLFLFGLLPALPSLSAADFGSLHQFNGAINTSDNVQILLHSRYRTDNHLSNFAQFRFGPVVNWTLTPKVQVQAGAYYLRQDAGQGTVTQYRPWAGVQLRVLDKPVWKVDWRNLLERHFVEAAPNFTRFRTRGMVTYTRGSLQPYASAESLFYQGSAVERFGTGMNFLWRGNILGVGYEYRGNVSGPGIHLVTTIIQFRLNGWGKRQTADASTIPPQ